jgi:lysozyme
MIRKLNLTRQNPDFNRGVFRNGAIILAALLLMFILWTYLTGWAPTRDEYPVQGLAVDESNEKPDWARLGLSGVDFAYLTATEGTEKRDKSFEYNLEGVKQAGIRYGVVHKFDICRLASDQATLFMTTVPRDKNALPPAVQIGFSDTCTSKPNRGVILSELATFMNQIEAHSGTPSILLLSRDFEQEYGISGAIDRTIWVEGTWFLPEYSAKPWVMWSANTHKRIGGVEGPVRWTVIRK